MTKYIEELSCGDAFCIDSHYYVLTIDFRKNGDKLAIDLKTGEPRWFTSNKIIEDSQLYVLDQDNNLVPIKPTEKSDVSN